MDSPLSTCTSFFGSNHTSRGCRDIFRKEADIAGQTATLVGNLIYVAGGLCRGYLEGVYALDVNSLKWTRKDVDEKLQLYDSTAFLVEDKIFIFSCASAAVQHNPFDTKQWTFDIVQGFYEACYSENAHLVPALGSAGEYLEAFGLIILYGGQPAGNVSNSIVGYSPSTRTWQPIHVKGGTPPPRQNHSSCLHGTSDIFFFGGNHDLYLTPSSAIFHLKCHPQSFYWSEVGWQPSPVARANSVMCCVGSRVFILGGYPTSGATKSNHLYMFDLRVNAGVEFEGLTIRSSEINLPLLLRGSACKRSFHCSVATGDKIFVIGGSGASGNEIYKLRASK